jgi:hypothetical protein
MPQTVAEMLRTTPQGPFIRENGLAECIEACFDCAQACVACADACLGEQNVTSLLKCIRLNLDCADVCECTGRLLSRQQQPDLELLRNALELCRFACNKCAAECLRHAGMHEHCRLCGESCRGCEDACARLLEVFREADVEAPH